MRQTLPKRHATADRVRTRCDVSDIEQSGFFEFDRWLGLARRTRELLDAAVDEGGLPAGGADYLADRTLPHLEGVQVGFLGWLRADAAGIAELRYLLGRVAAARVEPPVDDAERRAAAAEELDRAVPRGAWRAAREPTPERRAVEPRRARSRPGRPRLPAEDPRRRGSLSGGPENLRRHRRPARTGRARRTARRARAPAVADRDRPDAGPRGSGIPARVRLLRCGRPARDEGIRPGRLTALVSSAGPPGRRREPTPLDEPQATAPPTDDPPPPESARWRRRGFRLDPARGSAGPLRAVRGDEGLCQTPRWCARRAGEGRARRGRRRGQAGLDLRRDRHRRWRSPPGSSSPSGCRCSSASGSSARSVGGSSMGCCCCSAIGVAAVVLALGVGTARRSAAASRPGPSPACSSASSLALNMTNRGWGVVGDALLPLSDPGARPLAAALIVLPIVAACSSGSSA